MNLEELQTKIKKNKLNALYVTRNNMFLGQDVLEEENNILKLTGFTGSAGKLLVTQDKAFLFVDGRYKIQAALEVDLNKVEICELKNVHSKIESEAKILKSFKVGFNPWNSSIKDIADLERFCPNTQFIETEILPNEKSKIKPDVFDWDIKFAGISREEKIVMTMENSLLKSRNIDACFFNYADDVSWLLNLRSNYLPNSPILRAFVLIDKNDNITIFSDDIDLENSPINCKILATDLLKDELKKYKNMNLAMTDSRTAYILKPLAKKYKINLVNIFDLCKSKKSIKNPVELAGIKKAHIRDGVAVTKFLCWFDKNWKDKTELDIVEKLYDFRKKQINFFSNSFDTISAFGENGAIVHYHPNEKSNKKIEENNFLLLDSGGQYFDGTTDVTRTIPIGKISAEMKKNFTLVLKSHIALASTIFPEKTKSSSLDAIARSPLWKDGKDYEHGTSHGVGCFLNVHEGPVSISQSSSYSTMNENLVLSIEPGYYKENEYGIRIENLYTVVKINDETFENEMLGFEYLTMIPIDKKAINLSMLSIDEKKWLKDYHQKVFETLSPHLNKVEKEWLLSKIK